MSEKKGSWKAEHVKSYQRMTAAASTGTGLKVPHWTSATAALSTSNPLASPNLMVTPPLGHGKEGNNNFLPLSLFHFPWMSVASSHLLSPAHLQPRTKIDRYVNFLYHFSRPSSTYSWPTNRMYKQGKVKKLINGSPPPVDPSPVPGKSPALGSCYFPPQRCGTLRGQKLQTDRNLMIYIRRTLTTNGRWLPLSRENLWKRDHHDQRDENEVPSKIYRRSPITMSKVFIWIRLLFTFAEKNVGRNFQLIGR